MPGDVRKISKEANLDFFTSTREAATRATDLGKVAKDRGIEYFLVSFVDIAGVMRAKLVPATAIREMQKNGAGFAGFATHLDMTPAHPDMFAVPDPESLIQLPWKPEVGWLASDLWMDGRPVATSPRVALKSIIEQARKQGYRMKTGVECEFFLIQRDGMALADSGDTQKKPCYDAGALMRKYEIIRAICDGMLKLGWNPYQNDHEDGNGQFEMNWQYADALVTADRHAFFKYMVKSIAEQHGERATFMPKPFLNLTGNGCHMHVSVWDTGGKKNLFDDAKGELGNSQLSYQFLGGIIANAEIALRLLQPNREQLQAHQCAGHALRRDLGAQHGVLYREQSHAYDSNSGAGPVRVAPDGWGRQSLSDAGRRVLRPASTALKTRPIRASASTSTCTRMATS